MAEYWDIYTSDRCKTGEKMKRGSVFPEGAYHLVVHVCIFNKKGQMLIQQRQKDKEGWPNYWDVTIGGSALYGESSQEAAMREVAEEIGLNIDLKGVRPAFTINFNQGFDDTFLVQMDLDLESLVLQEEEVQAVAWAWQDDIKQMINDGHFIPYHHSKIDMCFDMRQQLGAIKQFNC
ncbi:NUDIX hydrolase [Streptococcus iniae]|uniref:NUDIX domain-containing protein n=1 Tax=Streptococcus iniae TaxID=1346 RepID=A0A3L8GSG2_STRIN|nr:NUDIX domain-containing protein [Streptococcus iniae]AGM97937.1 NUDIX hydrolase [Streptococcus iniae SF1]AHY15020.1 NUDIX hydrolase [Streptococcus iniae]AHY16891.1 NUDIX hydrolase [Streptococcus iniae]AJG25179.1 NUDIX hydrolase [Streptococcus iniae]APD31081.1 NUDIX hydrolase [Streptococcus iniae]